jgi:hypothetical protein
MSLLIAFAACVLVGQAISVAVGLIVEHFTSSEEASLIAFFPLYFAMFGVAWKVSVRMTEPRGGETSD